MISTLKTILIIFGTVYSKTALAEFEKFVSFIFLNRRCYWKTYPKKIGTNAYGSKAKSGKEIKEIGQRLKEQKNNANTLVTVRHTDRSSYFSGPFCLL